jgi:hypothetical protein
MCKVREATEKQAEAHVSDVRLLTAKATYNRKVFVFAEYKCEPVPQGLN